MTAPSQSTETSACPKCGSEMFEFYQDAKGEIYDRSWTCGSGQGRGCFEQSGICKKRERDRTIAQQAAVIARLKGEREALREAFADARDSILNGRGPLEATLDNDQTNAVLDVLDAAFAAALAPPAREGREGK